MDLMKEIDGKPHTIGAVAELVTQSIEAMLHDHFDDGHRGQIVLLIARGLFAWEAGHWPSPKETEGQLPDILTMAMDAADKARVLTVPERLEKARQTFIERDRVYSAGVERGDGNYKHFGKVMMGLFPHGVSLNDADEFARFALFCLVMVKQSRYAMQFKSGGHPDSLEDMAVYALMLGEVDDLFNQRKKDDDNQSR